MKVILLLSATLLMTMLMIWSYELHGDWRIYAMVEILLVFRIFEWSSLNHLFVISMPLAGSFHCFRLSAFRNTLGPCVVEIVCTFSNSMSQEEIFTTISSSCRGKGGYGVVEEATRTMSEINHEHDGPLKLQVMQRPMQTEVQCILVLCSSVRYALWDSAL